ncbi:hypothetical protein [Antarcticimicrobium sediminis]|nr:hypothetical protein [Antarcticimicrobium sediminis]
MKPFMLPILTVFWIAQAVSGHSQDMQSRIDELAAGMDDFAPSVDELPLGEIADDFGDPEAETVAPQAASEPAVQPEPEPAAPVATVAVIPEGWDKHSFLGMTFAVPVHWKRMSKPDDDDELIFGDINMAEKRFLGVNVTYFTPGQVDDFEDDTKSLPEEVAKGIGIDLTGAEQAFSYPDPIVAVDGRRILRKKFVLRKDDFFVYAELFYKEDFNERGGTDALGIVSMNKPEAEVAPLLERFAGTVGLEAAPEPEAQTGVDGLVNYSLPLPKGWKRQFNSSDAINFLSTPTYSASLGVNVGYRARENWSSDSEYDGAPEISRGEIFGQPATLKTGMTNEPYMQVGYSFVKALRKVYKLDKCLANGDLIVIQQYAAKSWLESTGYDSLMATMSLTLPADAIDCPVEGAATPTPATTPAPTPETASGWTTYTNSRFGTSLDYPTSHFQPAGAAPENGDGRSFVSPDRQAEVLVWGAHNALEQTPQQMMEEVRSSHTSGTVISQQADASGFTIKLLEGAKLIQQRSILDGGNVVHSLLVRYPANQDGKYGEVVQAMIASLSAPAAEAAPPTASAAVSDMEQAFWNSVKGMTRADGFEAYLQQFPNGAYAAEARQRIADLTAPAPSTDPQVELIFWQSIQSSSDPAMFQAYLDRWPNGTFAVLARLNLTRLTAVAVPPTPQPGPQPTPQVRVTPSARSYYTPARNTAERSAIMDAARVPMLQELGQRVIFLVKTLRTDGEWCFLMAEPLQPNGRKLNWYSTRFANDWANDAMSDLVMVLMHRQGSGWQVVDYVIGPTDVHWYNWIDSYGLPERLFNPG